MSITLALLCNTSVMAQTAVKDVPTYGQDKLALQVSASQPKFIIKLKSNPTTGYSWFLREYDANFITPIKHEFGAPVNRKLMGASGYEYWTFRVKPLGFTVPRQTLIRFIYARPWEADDSSTQVVYQVSTSDSD